MVDEIYQRELSVMDMVRRAWYVYRKDFKAISIMVSMVYVPILILNYFVLSYGLEEKLLLLLIVIVNVALVPIAYLGPVLIVEERVKDSNATIEWSTIKRKAYSRLKSCMGTAVLAFIMLVGLILCFIVPGIIWSIYYAFAIQVVILRGIGGKAALNYSKSVVKGRWWRVFARTAALVLIFAIAKYVVAFCMSPLNLVNHLFPLLISWGLMVVELSFQIIVGTIFFLNLDYTHNGYLDSINNNSGKVISEVED